jgi:hypothetical protein
MYYNAKSEDLNHNIGDKVTFKIATGNKAFYGEGIYLSDRVEIAYTRGAGCVYAFETDQIEMDQFKEEDNYKWFKMQHTDFEVKEVKEVSVEDALETGWDRETIESVKERREGFKMYILEPINIIKKEKTMTEKLAEAKEKAEKAKSEEKVEEKLSDLDSWGIA